MKKLLAACCLFLTIAQVQAQSSRYIVRFRNKGSNSFTLQNPSAWLSQAAIARRAAYNIPLDSTDLPVSPAYIDSLRLSGAVSILSASKWLNEVSIRTTDAAALAKIQSFPFVLGVSVAAARTSNPASTIEEVPAQPAPSDKEQDILADAFNYGAAYSQIHIHNGEFLHNIGLQGQGMTIGILDAGFFNYTGYMAFDSVRLQGRVLSTYDFVNLETSVVEDAAHGMQCFSVIAANVPGQMVGSAPRASFHLFRTEDANTEYVIEEHNWVCGAERIDSAGGQVISSSLGYNEFDDPTTSHTYADMNGDRTIAARGADLAVKKGLLVVNSVGNSGNDAWHYLVTPADGDSVLAVGAVTPSGIAASFSSYGPSSDGQVKPDVTSVGAPAIVQYTNNAFGGSNGTSFSAPNMAGLATCLWQGFPEVNNVRILQVLRRAGNQYTNPDARVGYGIPDMKKAVWLLLDSLAVSSATVSNCSADISFTSKDIRGMKYIVLKRADGQTSYQPFATIAATGASFSKQTYHVQDPSAIGGSYIIQQVLDTSATGFYAGNIDTLTVQFPLICNANTAPVLVFPNPSLGGASVRVQSTTGASLEMRVYSPLGQLMERRVQQAASANTVLDIHSYLWASGIYRVMVIQNGSVLATQPFLKL